jgi:hypothetical protein
VSGLSWVAFGPNLGALTAVACIAALVLELIEPAANISANGKPTSRTFVTRNHSAGSLRGAPRVENI